jgi:UDP-arabinose 4-epimerase
LCQKRVEASKVPLQRRALCQIVAADVYRWGAARMRVLVVGGAGYVGSHTCKALAEAGHTPIVYDNLCTGHSWAVKWGHFEHGDINDHRALAAAFCKHRPEAVMNFAAMAYVGESNVEPIKYYRVNVAGMISLIEIVQAYGSGPIVFSSSCATYGIPLAIPVTEDARQDPINPYGRSKLAAEEVLRDACAAYGLDATSLRYFNAAGADSDGEIGEEHDPETHLIPVVLEAAADKRAGVSIFGDDYDTPDGTCIRDFVHVTDLAAAHVAALSARKSGFSAYNLGTGVGCSIKEVIARARVITGRPIAVTIEKRRAGDPPVLVAESARAVKDLNWKPMHSNVDNVILTAWNWMKQHRREIGSHDTTRRQRASNGGAGGSAGDLHQWPLSEPAGVGRAAVCPRDRRVGE